MQLRLRAGQDHAFLLSRLDVDMPNILLFFSSQSCIALGVVDELRELVYFRGWVCAGFYVLLGTCEGSVCTNGARNLRAKLQEQQGCANKMSPLLTQHLGDTGTESL